MDNQLSDQANFNFSALSRGKKLVLIIFLIWLAQAIPKWSAAIMADDEMSAQIIGFFITPRYQEMSQPKPLEASQLAVSQEDSTTVYAVGTET